MQSLDTNIPHFLRCVVCFKVPYKAITLDKIRIICRKCQKTNQRQQQNSSSELFQYLLQNFKVTCSKCKQILVCQEYEKHKTMCNQKNKLNYQQFYQDDQYQIRKQFEGRVVQIYIMESERDCLIKKQKQIQCQYCLRFMTVIQYYEHQRNCLEFEIDCGNYDCIWQGKRKEFLCHFGQCLIHTLNVLDKELEQQLTTRHLLEQQQQMMNIKEHQYFEDQQILNNNYNFTYQPSSDSYIFD